MDSKKGYLCSSFEQDVGQVHECTAYLIAWILKVKPDWFKHGGRGD